MTADSNPKPPDPVDEKFHALRDEGAMPVYRGFRVARTGQEEVVYHDQRLLITPRTPDYHEYVDHLVRVGLPYVAPNLELSTESVVVGAIPRDARTFPQIMRSEPSQEGTTPKEAFYLFGRAIGALGDAEKVVPASDDVTLDRTLIVRKDLEIMFVPPLHFVPDTLENRQSIVDSVRGQLVPDYSRFGADAMLECFKEGIE